MTLPIFDIAIVGGGIVGLACALTLNRTTNLKVAVLEKELRCGQHQSGHNSGVIHSGIYYPPDSLKARNCMEGRRLMEAFCQENGVPLKRTGKLLVATGPDEAERLLRLAKNGAHNGLEALCPLNPTQVEDLAPGIKATAGLLVPQTGIVDYKRVTRAMVRVLQSGKASVITGFPVQRISGGTADAMQLCGKGGQVRARFMINAAGLQCDRVARLAGCRSKTRIVPFRGDYYRLKPPHSDRFQLPVYPVPDPALPFLGVHFTPTMDGTVECGPNASLALSREGYDRFSVNGRDLLGTIVYSGVWKLAGRYPGVAVKEWGRSHFKGAFAGALKQMMPELQASWLTRGGCGIRAQAMDAKGKLEGDFVIEETKRSLHVLNAPSPAATASFAIAEQICTRAKALFNL